MISRPARTFFLIVLALVFRSATCGESLLAEDPYAVTLPLEIEINGTPKGEIIIRSDASLQIVEIEGSILKELLTGKVVDDLNDLVAALPEGFHTLESYQELGLEIALDLERLVVALQIQERAAYLDEGIKRISLGYHKAPNYEAHTRQATLSGYANFRLRSTISAREGAETTTRNQLGISHVLNLKGYALEGESRWSENDRFQTSELRLVKDFPQHLWRLSAGDVSTPVIELQRGFQIFGANLSKEFGIQPYRTFTPTGSAAFEIAEPATVTVKVNGATTRTLQLDPGNYNIDEFKLVAGPNQMDLQIETQSGLIDTLSVSEFGALNHLDAGVSTYSFSYGLPRTSASATDARTISSSNWYQRYTSRTPIFSGYYKRGLTNQLTFSLDAQGSSEWNRLGTSVSAASERFGAISLALSHNQTNDTPGALSTRLNWSRRIAGYQLSLNSLYTQSGYHLTRSGQTASPLSIKSSNSLNISKLLFEKLNVSTIFLQQNKHDGTSTRNLSLTLGRRIGKIYTSLSLRHSRTFDSSDYNAYLTCTWNPARKWRTRSQVRSSNIPGATSVSTNIDYANRRADDYFNLRLNALHSDTGYNLGGSFDYQAGLYSAAFSHNQVYGAIDDYVNKGTQTNLTATSAIAFADGAFGFANRIRNSFAIISKHDAWSEVNLGINPTVGGFEKNNTSPIFSAVLPSLLPYREAAATVQTVDSDLFLERNDYYFFPNYKRGTKLKLGNDAIYAARGTLLYSDEVPVKYKGVRLTSDSGKIVDTFTNGAGRFMASSLTPGTYKVTVANTSEFTEFAVVKGETMIILGKLLLQEKEN
ncbi:fimbria/pilus outer membrane usher protein [Pelagicoccus mobilis]|uniref:Fimbrial biogenesis outer membrane usher protein n=1 Tax=Pelagicoccus mobilis TaxID=415221 RepID=A0A934RZY2_9BACT|nr:fimbria/pilus outer membrane usher protein [Pelagicoccus mobilis]MBK1879827.1 fimbrial biogenesis outer membrane usher protein [Pelagicoccus mobilis]